MSWSVGYKKDDVKTGKGGYAKIRRHWLTLNVRENLYDNNGMLMLPKALTVSKLAWGKTFLGDLDDYVREYRITPNEAAELIGTLTDEEIEKAQKLGLIK